MIGAYVDQSMGSKSGSAFIFKWSHGKWKEVQSLSSMLDSAADYFGQDVGIHENRIIVGAYGMFACLSRLPIWCYLMHVKVTVTLLAITMEPRMCTNMHLRPISGRFRVRGCLDWSHPF